MGLGLEVVLVALGLRGRRCVPNMGGVGGIGVEGTSVSPKWGTLVALGWK